MPHRIMKLINRNPIFRYLSSVRLAVPLILIMATVVAIGTLIESRYNADYAKMLVYQAWWFELLLALLGVNIFCAALSRWPFRKRHTGFVITHIGLITLLVGAYVTSRWGIDGQLQVVEGSKSSTVILSDLSIELMGDTTYEKSVFPRKPSSLSRNALAQINSDITSVKVSQFEPFVKPTQTYESEPSSTQESPSPRAPVALGFLLRSQFFNVSRWLHSSEEASVQMGPASISIQVHETLEALDAFKATQIKPVLSKDASGQKNFGHLVIKAGDSGAEEKISVDELLKTPYRISGYQISVTQTFQRAVVVDNRIQEGGDSPNPAVEVEITKGEKKSRDIFFSKYPDFSLNPDLDLPFKLSFVAGEFHRTHASTTTSNKGNQIVFHVIPNRPQASYVQLLKNGEHIKEDWLESGETLQTPWMGMKISLGEVVWDASSQKSIEVTQPEEREPLPPSAIQIQVPQSKDLWLVEGEYTSVKGEGKTFEIYYGRNLLELPFALHLKDFRKKDYPGTETAVSFESDVLVDGHGEKVLVSMNEPLKRNGYTFYQSSYQLRPGQPAISIFSVNRDPGRPIKYGGSVILAVGIIVLTISRSRLGKRQQ